LAIDFWKTGDIHARAKSSTLSNLAHSFEPDVTRFDS
jgi:hypothetical protein